MSDAIANRHWRAAGASLALVVVLVTFGDVLIQELHGTAAFYAALVREMIEQRDPLAPFHGPQAYLLKPPLAFWSSALSASLFGLNDFAMTLPSRLAGLGCVALTFILGRRFFGPLAGWFAALVFATNGIYIQFTTSFRMDSIMTLGALLTLWGYFELRHPRGAAAFFGGIAISALTKGPMIFVMLLVFVPHALLTGQWRGVSSHALRWSLLLLPPAAWYAYLYGAHGTELAAQLNYDFWRGDTAVGLTGVESALLEYLFKPLRRLWPWLPLMVLAVGYGVALCVTPRRGPVRRADLALLVALFALNYGIAAIKPDPDVRYLYPSLPLVAVLCGGLLARWTGQRMPRGIALAAHGLAALALAAALLVTVRGLDDARGLRELQRRVARMEVDARNAVVVTDSLRPPGAPRRNDPMPDSVYYYFGLQLPAILMPVAAHELTAATRYVFVRRKRIYEATLRGFGFTEVGRSAKIALFERR